MVSRSIVPSLQAAGSPLYGCNKTYVHIEDWRNCPLQGGKDPYVYTVWDKCLGMLEAVVEVFPVAKYQRCPVHFYRNVLSVVSRSKVKLVAKMLKAIHTHESKKPAREKRKLW